MRTLLFFCAITLLIASCQHKTKEKATISKNSLKGDVIIFHAGSMAVPLKEVADSFMKENPEIKIMMEVAGSRECGRKITDLGKKCDIMVSADYAVIDEMLVPDYTDWNIKFATNEMVIAFTSESKLSDKINADNWYELLLNKDVRFGRSDPNSDPGGYRTVLLFKLAQSFYHKPDLSLPLMQKDLNYIRPKEVDLLGLIEAGELDYIFIYKSVAEQHQLKYITLPDSINLKNFELKDYYANASVEVSGKKPGETTTIKGEPMLYSVTLLKNATENKAATAFLSYFMDKDKGLKIIEKNGQAVFTPSVDKNYESLPEELKKVVSKK